MTGRIRFTKAELHNQYGELDWPDGISLMDRLISAGLPVASSCGGDGVCTKCRLKVRGTPLPPSNFEKGLLLKISADRDERISCQVLGPGEIEVDASYW